MRLIKQSPKQPEGAVVAQVSFSESGGFGAVGASEHRGIPVFSPRGVHYKPCEGDNLLILPVDGTDVCVGVLSPTGGMEAGELRLMSSGGAELRMKNNGDIVLNGLTITKHGEIVPPGEGE